MGYNIICLIACGDLADVQELVINSVNVNESCLGGNTPLLFAVACGNLDIVKYLLANEANPNDAPRGWILRFLAKFLYSHSYSPLHQLCFHAINQMPQVSAYNTYFNITTNNLHQF